MAGSPLLESLLAVTERQGLFKGDIHLVQRYGLQFTMNREVRDQSEIETYRAKITALASNQATSPDLIKSLFELEKTEEEIIEEEIEWVTPQSTDQLADVLKEWDLDLVVDDVAAVTPEEDKPTNGATS